MWSLRCAFLKKIMNTMQTRGNLRCEELALHLGGVVVSHFQSQKKV